MITKFSECETKERLKRFIVHLFTNEAFERYHIEIARKITMLHILSVIGIMSTLLFGLDSLKRGDHILGYFDLISTIILLIGIIYLRKNNNYKLVGCIDFFTIGSLIMYIIISGGGDNSGHVWGYLFPIAVFFVFGLKTGITFIFGFFIVLLYIFFPIGTPILKTAYSSVFKLRVIGSLLAVSAISCFYEYVRAKTQGMLEQRNSALQNALQKLQQTYAALQKSETQYRMLFESANDAISIIGTSPMNNNYHIVDCNGKMLDLFHCTQEQIIGKKLDHFSPDFQLDGTNSHEKIMARIHEALQDEPQFFEWNYICPDCSVPLVAEVSLNRVKLSEEVFIQTIMRDISDRKKMEEELRRSNTELEQFAYIASHDLQEPLRMVSSYLQLLVKRNKYNLDSDSHKFIDYAVDGAKRMKKLIDDILTYSRVGTHGKDFTETDCEIAYKTAIKNLEIRITETNAKVYSETLPTLIADQGQLVQLFQNLIGNSLKFCKDHTPEIHLFVHQESTHWIFGIKDNGIGIAPEDKERIFKIFQRIHTTAMYEGSGIGLAVCKKIVERHGGTIGVESEPGSGATFYFTIQKRKLISGTKDMNIPGTTIVNHTIEVK